MSAPRPRPALFSVLFYALMFTLASYFTFAAVQGNSGLFRRIQLGAEVQDLTRDRDRLAAELAVMQNTTRRLSDEYLDLDLLDQQARDVLGVLRSDEVVVR